MIVTATDEGWRCVTQPDHARLSRDVLALWRADGLPEHPRRAELLDAVLEHDNGWREADSAPRLHPSGVRPHDFLSHPHGDRLEIWRRGIDRYREQRPYTAALILEHAAYLHRDHRGDGAWDPFLDELEARRDALTEAADSSSAELAADYRWLHVADLISLAVCADWRQPFERWGTRGRWRGGVLELAPFPLAGVTRFSVPCRHLPEGEHTSDSALATALATCRWQRLEFRIAPAEKAGHTP